MMIELILQLFVLDVISEILHSDPAESLNQEFVGQDLIDLSFVEGVKNRVFFVCVDPRRRYPLQMIHWFGLEHPGVLHDLEVVGHFELSTLRVKTFSIKKFGKIF